MLKKDFLKFRVFIIFLAAFAVFVLFFYFQPDIGNFLWKEAGFPRLAVFVYPDAKFAVNIGNYYFNVGGKGDYDLARAEKFFRYALFLNSRVPDAWHELARIDFLRGDFAGALEKINKQIALHGDLFMASFYIRGLINGYAGNFDEAERDFKKFLEWDKTNWAVHNDLAWIYFQKGDYKKTEEIARAGLEFNRGNIWLLISLGVALLNQEKKEEARKILEEAGMAATLLSETDWQKAYPGNNPLWAKTGLEKMKETIEFNLGLVR
ncbi:MAG: hypothetical protein A3G49_02530 [Candidatus Sungbacteria bacterium RIFCSPLOWO2_12_FULL_41_11]|uniref:Uncharacterized protein n=1 Tax=Candidatus Sungbacteria bacterium RIFCSPLOWO2_12_FULL_41_11 TaxID=1802286 RepID=A0A1G2LNM2_9BACT|nr:MAG: hypothetical protein UV01_C0004G0095 [Parcubacteria group bacterium GW2011_GWA2_42_14]OHA13218.1 MAG: hypothetical protein A3G49_02530 [Candidatus Sungbacteria bacterium RIFCSPLOWO2_12_FULL_41_11]